MIKNVSIELFKRDIEHVRKEIAAYKSESAIWEIAPGISNSGGNLCLHLIGNLNHFIGAGLGNTGYIRNRDNEFAAKNIPQADLINELGKTALMVEATLIKLSDADFEKAYPGPKTPFGDVSTGYFTMHLLAHLNYHLGQINYHRRLLEAA